MKRPVRMVDAPGEVDAAIADAAPALRPARLVEHVDGWDRLPEHAVERAPVAAVIRALSDEVVTLGGCLRRLRADERSAARTLRRARHALVSVVEAAGVAVAQTDGQDV